MAAFSDAQSKCWPFIRNLLVFDVLDSTNDFAAEYIRAGATDYPLVVVARSQSRGRGRGSRQWWSDTGSLTFTLAIDASAHGVSVESEPKMALAMAVAVVDSLVALKLEASTLGIRWPNDLEVGGRKLGGILPERIEADEKHYMLIGVGLNVLTDLAVAPVEVQSMATSLINLHTDQCDEALLPRLLSSILGQFEVTLGWIATRDPRLPERWNELDRLKDQWVRVDLGPRIVAGIGCGIDADGSLYLDDGRQHHRIFGGTVLR